MSAHSPAWKAVQRTSPPQQVRREFPSVSEVPLIEDAMQKTSQLESQLKQATQQADVAKTELARQVTDAHRESRVAHERATQADLLQKRQLREARDAVSALRRESRLAEIWARGFVGRTCFRGYQSGHCTVFSGACIIALQLFGRSGPTGTHGNAVLTTKPRAQAEIATQRESQQQAKQHEEDIKLKELEC